MVAVMLLVACSSGEDAPENPPTPPTDPTESASKHEIPVMFSMSSALFDDWTEEQRATRRTEEWNPPTGYDLYEKLYQGETYVNLPNLGRSTIDLFMTHDNAEGDAKTTENPLHARLRYSPSATTDSKWKLVLPNNIEEDSVKQGNYYAYGFVPKDAADSATIAQLPGSSKWADGAVLTIKGLKTVATDPCFIIGASHGPNDYNDGELTAGDFQFRLSRESDPPINYLYFLFDHLYSAFSISMRVNGTYHALRHIKLKAIYLQTETISGVTPSKANVTITLNNKDNEGKKPIVEDITYTPADNTPTDHQIFRDPAGYALTDEFSMFLGHFMPNSVSKLILTSVYDIYDTNTSEEYPDGNLIRKDCSATNTLLLSSLFNGQAVSTRGWKYKVKLTINPTYLYVMSDPDLDNPTVVVN